VESSAFSVRGDFPLSSGISTITAGGGRSAASSGDDGGDWLRVAIYAPAERAGSQYTPGKGNPEGRAPAGGWPANWTFLTNDTDNLPASQDNIDILKICMTDNANYIFFKIVVENVTNNMDSNDQWNFYFKTNDSTNNNFDVWYRLSLTVNNSATPTFNSALYMYMGANNPPDRSDFTLINESHNGTGNSSDGTAYGYWFDRANLSVNFYVVKSKIYGNMLGPGNTTRVYADTWYIRNNGRWNRADRAPNRSQTVGYTMVPEFQDIIAPVAGSILVYVILRRRRSGLSATHRSRSLSNC
jgi:hypothetical protein